MLRNKTAIECWNIIKYVIESIIDKFVPLKNKENCLERNTCGHLRMTQKCLEELTLMVINNIYKTI